MKFIYHTLLVAALVLFGAGLRAQSLTTAALNGQVSSSTGEPLAGATVRLTHVPTGTPYGVVANDAGRFFLSGLRTGGPYTLTIEYVGYEKFTASDIYLNLGSDKSVNVVMKETGTALGTVEIASRRDPIINSGRTGANTEITQRQFENMPTLNRGLESFTRLTPQASAGGFGGREGRTNNYTLDGALLNNNFGLGGAILPGDRASSGPVSLDALEQANVSIAPYDVRQFGFTGGGIALVTRSGTNEFEGSVAWFGQRGNWSRNSVNGQRISLAFAQRDQFVARVSGPIIKDKLFFSVVFERTQNDRPGNTFRAANAGETGGVLGGVVSTVQADSLNLLANEVKRIYGYDVGGYGITNFQNEDLKVNFRLDWNISQNHKVSARYNVTDAFDINPPSNSTTSTGMGNRTNSLTTQPFSSSFYDFIENNNVVSLEWNGTFLSGKVQNQLLATAAFLWSPQVSRSSGNFPHIDIANRVSPGQTATSFGTEQFRQENSIKQDQYLLQNNTSIYLGNHNVTVGFQLEYYKFNNRFQPQRWGRWAFRSFDSFLRNIRATEQGLPIDASAEPVQVNISYEFTGRSSDAFVDAMRIGGYIQDKWTVKPGLNITAGLRLDVPVHITEPLRNETVYSLLGVSTNVLPKDQYMISPRLGVNWDVFNDGKLQVRGGTGLFSGNIPFVWMTNNVAGTGLQTGSVIITDANGISPSAASPSVGVPIDNFRRFLPTVPGTQLLPLDKSPTAGTANVSYADPDFKYPMVWRTSLGADYSIGDGWVISVDYAYTQDLYAVIHQNMNLRPDYLTRRLGPDGSGAPEARYYLTSLASAPSENSSRNPALTGLGRVVKLANVNDGWSDFITFQIKRNFDSNFEVFAAYTYTRAKAATDSPGDQAYSSWQANPIQSWRDPNASVLQDNRTLRPHRLILGGQYELNSYSKYASTTFSLFYELESGARITYVYNGDVNSDGSTFNDLVFVPANASQITLLPGTGTDTRTAAQMWTQLDAFISSDPYLNSRRGQFVERNGGKMQAVGTIDVGVRQDFKWEVAGRPNKLQISVDIINFGNLINQEWGVRYSTTTTNFLQYVDNSGPGNTAAFRFPLLNNSNQIPYTATTTLNPGALSSRFRIQFGVRYIWGR